MKLNDEQKKDLIERYKKVVNDFKGHTRFPFILLEMMELHSSKSNDYATDESPFSNIELCERAGVPAWKGVVIRLGDKYSRLCQLARKGEAEVKDETFEDTCLDLAVYALILRMLKGEKNE